MDGSTENLKKIIIRVEHELGWLARCEKSFSCLATVWVGVVICDIIVLNGFPCLWVLAVL